MLTNEELRLLILKTNKVYSERFQKAINLAQEMGAHNLAAAMETMAQEAGLIATIKKEVCKSTSGFIDLDYAKNRILELIHKDQDITIHEIAFDMGIGMNTASKLVQNLCDEKKLIKNGFGKSRTYSFPLRRIS